MNYTNFMDEKSMSEEIKIAHVARYILERLGPISTMKLQKLCYYTQVWHSYLTKDRLFSEEFQAWTYGPVCYELFQHHRGKYKVAASDFAHENFAEINLKSKQIIDQVIEVYGKFTGEELSALSHSESPWIEARLENSSDPDNVVISIERMTEFAAAINDSK